MAGIGRATSRVQPPRAGRPAGVFFKRRLIVPDDEHPIIAALLLFLLLVVLCLLDVFR